MMGKDRLLRHNTCKVRAHASEQAVAGVQGPGLNEVVMGFQTLSSGVNFGFMSGCCGGKEGMKPYETFHGGWAVY